MSHTSGRQRGYAVIFLWQVLVARHGEETTIIVPALPLTKLGGRVCGWYCLTLLYSTV